MSLQITKDILSRVLSETHQLLKQEVLVGVPYENAPRNAAEDESAKGTPITNAVIGYVNEFGAPEINLPARPHLIPGIHDAKDQIVACLKAGADAALRGKKNAGHVALERAGFVAEAAVKRKISDGLSPTLAPSTIEGRHRQRGTSGMRKSELLYSDLVRSGVAPGVAQATAEIKALINTGEYMRSITHVVRDRKK